MIKRIFYRFIRAFVAGAAGTMALVAFSGNNDWSNIVVWLNLLSIAGVVGGVSGVIMAADKYFRDR